MVIPPSCHSAESAAVTRPLSAYGADKLGCELHGRVASQGPRRSRPTGFRFFNVYGPRQDPGSPYSGVISIFFNRISRGQGIKIFGDGGQTRDFIYVADVVRALLAAMGQESPEPAVSPEAAVFNVCTGKTTSLLELAATIGRVFGRTPTITFEAGRAGDIRASLGNPEMARDRLGFAAKFSLEDGLRLMADYESEHINKM